MQTAYLNLVRHALSLGYTVSVWDGEEWQVKRSTSIKAISEAVKSVDEAELRFRDGEKIVGWARVSAFGLEPDETVMDHTTQDWLEAWSETYLYSF
jgi:hypothetical protein